MSNNNNNNFASLSSSFHLLRQQSVAAKNTLLNVEVVLLDGTDKTFELDPKGLGLSLLDAVAEHLGLLEKDYFGFLVWENVDCTWTWLNNEAKLLKQFKHNPKCYFQVKFYPPEPSHLQEDLTRYLLCLQLQSDIKQGKLPCSFVTHTLLGAFMVQSELGDHDPDQHGQGIDYLRDFDFAPSQSDELLEKIWTAHKKLKGQTSAEAELHYLENAKKLAMYGFSLQNAKDSEGIDIVLGVCSSGVVIFRDNLRINRFVWPKIIKLAYKNANFFLKLRPGEHEHIEYTVGFRLRDHREAKRLWKISVEHHSFFRLESQEPKERFSLLSFSGSTFRYYGRTQFEVKMNSKLLKEQMTRDALMDEEGDDNYPQIPSSYHKHRNPHYHPPVKEPEVEEDQKSDQKANESLAPSQSTSTMDDTPVIDLSITGNKRTSIFDTASVTTVGGKPRYQSPWGKSSAIMTRRKFLEATPGSFLLDDRQPLLSKAAIATSPSHLKSGLSNKGMLYTILSENKEELLRKRMAQQQNCDENEAETSLAEPPVCSRGEQESEDKNDGKVVVEVHEELCDHDDDSLKEECIIELTNGDKEDEPDTVDQDQPSVPDCDVRPAESNDEGAATSP